MNVSYFKNEANQKSEITHIGDNNGVSGEEESLEKKGVFLALDIYLIEQSLKKEYKFCIVALETKIKLKVQQNS